MVEDRIKESQECGGSPFHCSGLPANRLRPLLVPWAQDPLAWARQLYLPTELLATAPKRLRYQLLHVAGPLVPSGRLSTPRLDAHWSWATELAAAFTRLRSLPLTARHNPGERLRYRCLKPARTKLLERRGRTCCGPVPDVPTESDTCRPDLTRLSHSADPRLPPQPWIPTP